MPFCRRLSPGPLRARITPVKPETISIESDGLRFSRGVLGRPVRVAASQVQEVCSGWFPPALRLRDGNDEFVSMRHLRELVAWAGLREIPPVARTDVWSLILEPFLDTEFSEPVQRATQRQLKATRCTRRTPHATTTSRATGRS
jgi:hypothetical protein